ncbi:hypothetical protein HORIV_03770 [Vreelandella olivaria]|uniref:Uncharacterized protein n=1 Tax=Vreelandella olivaria TaxID=390919 RepID=A0ABM7GC52_9GAMM|nr:hypothetical protein HORIV_03770 [Halomonas olivaria]
MVYPGGDQDGLVPDRGVDLQLIHQLWLLPCAFIGHLAGEKAHRYMLKADTGLFFRVLGRC